MYFFLLWLHICLTIYKGSVANVITYEIITASDLRDRKGHNLSSSSEFSFRIITRLPILRYL
jgi:uncharacterized membrane protein YozB (DUF420 family)